MKGTWDNIGGGEGHWHHPFALLLLLQWPALQLLLPFAWLYLTPSLLRHLWEMELVGWRCRFDLLQFIGHVNIKHMTSFLRKTSCHPEADILLTIHFQPHFCQWMENSLVTTVVHCLLCFGRWQSSTINQAYCKGRQYSYQRLLIPLHPKHPAHQGPSWPRALIFLLRKMVTWVPAFLVHLSKQPPRFKHKLIFKSSQSCWLEVDLVCFSVSMLQEFLYCFNVIPSSAKGHYY